MEPNENATEIICKECTWTTLPGSTNAVILCKRHAQMERLLVGVNPFGKTTLLIDPTHPATEALRERWPHIAGILLVQHFQNLGWEDVRRHEVILTQEDFAKFREMFKGDTVTLLCNSEEDGLHVSILPYSEAIELRKKMGVPTESKPQ